MASSDTLKKLLLLVAGCGLASYKACTEGYSHDQSGSCVIDPFMPPPFLGFEYWGTVGIILAVFALGIAIACVMIGQSND